MYAPRIAVFIFVFFFLGSVYVLLHDLLCILRARCFLFKKKRKEKETDSLILSLIRYYARTLFAQY